MAINFTDYTRLPLQDMVPDVLGHYLRGVQAGHEPERLRREAKQRELQEALLSQQVEQNPQLFEQELLGKQLGNEFQQMTNAATPEDIRIRQIRERLQAEGFNLSNEQTRQLMRHAEAEHPLAMQTKRASIAESLAKANAATNPLSEEEKSRQKYAGKSTAEFQNKLGDDILGLASQKQSLDYMGGLLNSYDDVLKNSVGPITSVVEKYAGPDASQALLAQIDAASGEMVLNVLKSIPGASSNKELDFAKSIKLSGSDTYPAFKAKYQALNAFNDLTSERYRLINENMKTMPKSEAVLDAIQRTPTSSVIEHYQRLANPTREKSAKGPSLEGKPTSELFKDLWKKS